MNQDMEDKDWENNIADERNCYSQMDAEDVKAGLMEALKRLSGEMKDKTKLEMLVRYVVNDEDRAQLAREYHVDNDYVSLVKTRYLKRLQELVLDVFHEDEHGSLEESTTDIGFLRPYMVNW